MILRESSLQDLDAMVQIIDSCREALGVDSELNWNKRSLDQAITKSSGQLIGAYQLQKLIGFILFKDIHGAISSHQLEKKNNQGPVLGMDAVSGEKSISFCGLSAVSGEKLISSCLEIWCLATHPAFQGEGVMSALLQELKLSTEEIWLEVHEWNTTAIHFYKNQRFQQVGRRSNYYKDGRAALLFTWKAEHSEIEQ